MTFYNRFYYTLIGVIIGHNIGMTYYIYSLINYKNFFLLNNRYTIIDYSLYGGITGGALMYISYNIRKVINS